MTCRVGTKHELGKNIKIIDQGRDRGLVLFVGGGTLLIRWNIVSNPWNSAIIRRFDGMPGDTSRSFVLGVGNERQRLKAGGGTGKHYDMSRID